MHIDSQDDNNKSSTLYVQIAGYRIQSNEIRADIDEEIEIEKCIEERVINLYISNRAVEDSPLESFLVPICRDD
eukprot:scaffold194534_cov23-Cyclotella_meneghiniana.AAC.1